MPPRTDPFAPVAAIGRTLPDVELTTTWGKAALKVRGKMFACIASHKSAEPDTLVVMMDIADREALLEEDPEERVPEVDRLQADRETIDDMGERFHERSLERQ